MNDSLSLALGHALMEGVEAYSDGAEIWEQHKDESP